MKLNTLKKSSQAILLATATVVVSLFSEAALAVPTLTKVTYNAGKNYAYSGGELVIRFFVSEPCPVGGCIVNLYTNNSTLVPIPTKIKIAEGATKRALKVIVGSTKYPQPVSISATLNGSSKYSPYALAIFAPLGVQAGDGSYEMMAYGSSSRTGSGSVTKSLNMSMALKNMNYNASQWLTKQCAAAVPGGVLFALQAPVGYGEYKNINGLLTYEYTQWFRCSL